MAGARVGFCRKYWWYHLYQYQRPDQKVKDEKSFTNLTKAKLVRFTDAA